MAGAVRVQGYTELQRSFAKLSKDLKSELRGDLVAAAEPIRARAQELADSEISSIGPTWDRMRVGVTTKAVYVAPKSRRKDGSPRPNLASLLMDRAMSPALEDKQEEVVELLDLALGKLAGEAGF